MLFKRKEKAPQPAPANENAAALPKKRGWLKSKFARAAAAGTLVLTAVAVPMTHVGVDQKILPPPINDARPMPLIFGGVADRSISRHNYTVGNWFEMRRHYAEEKQDPARRAELKKFYSQFDDLRGKPIAEMARAVDGRIDKLVAYTPDPQTYCAGEYWATPLQTERLGKGDCEDFAIIKYYVLRELGVPANKMFVAAVGYDGADHINHATLIVDIGEGRGYALSDAIRVPGQPRYEWKPTFVELADDGVPRLVDITKSKEAPFIAMNEEGVWRVTPPPGRIRAPEARPPKPPPEPVRRDKNGHKIPPPKTPPCVPPSV